MTDSRITADLHFMEARALLQQAYERISAGNDLLRGEPDIELIADMTKDLLDTTLRNLGITRRHIEKATGRPRAVKKKAEWNKPPTKTVVPDVKGGNNNDRN